MKRRLHAALLSVPALILGLGAVALSSAGPVHADTLPGTVTLSPAGGNIADDQPFSSITVSQACPEHYQDSIEAGLVFDDGGVGDVVWDLMDGAPYSTGPFTAQVPAVSDDFTQVNSIEQAFDGGPGVAQDGTYPLVVVCHSADPETYPDRPTFQTFITVTGSTWAVKEVTPPTATTVDVTADPAGHGQVSQEFTLTAKVSPAAATGKVEFFVDGSTPVLSNTSPEPRHEIVPVVNGTAAIHVLAQAVPIVRTYTAVFTADDATAFAQGTGTANYAFVDEPLITALDDTGNDLQDKPVLTAGQRITLTVAGFLPAASGTDSEPVDVTLDGAAATPDTATADSQGTVGTFAYTVPGSVTDGSHALTFKGRTSAISESFAFTVGADESTTGGTDTGGTDTGGTDTGGSDAGGTDSGGTDTGGTDTGGADSGGTDTGGGSGGTGSSGGSGELSSGGSTAGGTSGGGTGPLAATGAGGILPLSGLALLLAGVGGYAVHRVRRDGKLLSFGPTPRD